jgi:fructose-1,6-bisphosphatase I
MAKEAGPYALRYSGALLADFHRILFQGGVFYYSQDEHSPQGKLRLLYECAPLAMIAEEAGGAATDGKQRGTTIDPKQIHQRTPLCGWQQARDSPVRELLQHVASTKRL